MINILIADDHTLVREGLKKIIKEETDITVIAEASNAMEVLGLLRKKHADVLLLDIAMPGMSGLDLLRDLRNLKNPPKVLILSMYPEDRFAIRALKSGASGYMTKEAAAEELPRAIRKIASGGKFISSTLAEHLAADLERGRDIMPHEELSEREFEVFLMLASGKTVGSIAEELALSVTTISTYRARILQKLNLRTNADLTQYAYANKLLQ